MYSDIISMPQLVSIGRGDPEVVVIPKDGPSYVVLTMMYALYADCVPIIGGVQMDGRYLQEELHSLGFHHIESVQNLCNVYMKVETYTITMRFDPENSGEYGMHCRRPNETDHFLNIAGPVTTIKVILIKEDEDMEEQPGEPPAAPVIELLINSSHLIVPPQNLSAFFDVRITPPPDDITFYRTTSGPSQDVVQTELQQGLFRIAFYRIKDAASGVYQLDATLNSLTSSQLITMTIAEKIVVHVSQLRRAVAEGASAELVCTVTGWPLPQVNWTMGLGPVPQNEVCRN